MHPRLRVYSLVAAAAAAAAALAVGVTLATRTPPPPAPQPQAGLPPLALDFGVRSDPEAVALERAEAVYDAAAQRDDLAAARRAEQAFSRQPSLEAQVGAAVAAWPDRSLQRLEALARAHPRSALVQVNLGVARYWAGDPAAAVQAWQAAQRAQPDTFYAIRADGLLHPRFAPGLPPFTPSFPLPATLTSLPAARQLAALRSAARGGGVRARLLYGAALQRLGHPLSAERQFALAAAAAPDDPEAQTAAAVGLFDKSDPAKAFSRLGPLSRRFPHAQTVRFHLGLMLVWMAQVPQARVEFARAVADGPGTQLGREARSFLARLGNVGTK